MSETRVLDPPVPPPVEFAKVIKSTALLIRELKEWEEAQAATDKTLLLQCGSPTCVKCPAFTECIDGLKEEWQFNHVYVNTHDAEEDLLEELQVTQLPAYVLISKDNEAAKGQAAKPEEVEVAIRTFCTPVFRMDADF